MFFLLKHPAFLDKIFIKNFSQLISKDESELTIWDVISYIPQGYDMFFGCEDILLSNNTKDCILEVCIIKHKTKAFMNSKIPYRISCSTNMGFSIDLVFFNKYPNYIALFAEGKRMCIRGSLSKTKSGFSIVHPRIIYDDRSKNADAVIGKLNIKNAYIVTPFTRDQIYINGSERTDDIMQLGKFKGMTPYYKLTKNKISNAKMIESIKKCFDQIFNEEIFGLEKSDLVGAELLYVKIVNVLYELHFSSNIDDILSLKSIKYMAKYEILMMSISLKIARLNAQQSESYVSIYPDPEYSKKVKKNLPFNLTKSQEDCILSISLLQKKKSKMFHMLQGDVGSGKTTVSLMLCVHVLSCDMSAVVIAPTSVLAEQHFNFYSNSLFGTSAHVFMINSSTKQKERKKAMQMLKEGYPCIIVCTHAVFYLQDSYDNVGLCVVDEQQRFGVSHRSKLLELFPKSDILLMTATPIPRTLMMSIYGDIEVSILTKEHNLTNVETRIILEERVDNLISRLIDAISKGKKAYWVCRSINESGDEDDVQKKKMSSVEDRYNMIKKKIKDDICCIVHGKMPKEKIAKEVRSFKSGEKKLMISTTVIEVGIDVPDASIIVIEDAHMFGLSQLHQLRGRVGRDGSEAFCLLLTSQAVIENETESHLFAMKQFSNGFDIAQKDLEKRGGGDVLGIKQSGSESFKFINNYFVQKDVLLKLGKEKNDDFIKKVHSLSIENIEKDDLIKNMLILFGNKDDNLILS